MWRVKTWNCTAWKILVKKTGNLADKFNNGKWLGTESSESSSFLASSWAALTKMLLLSEHICLSWSLTTFRWFFTHVFGTHCDQPLFHNMYITTVSSLRLFVYCADPVYNKGQLISKCLFGDFNFFQKTNENPSHSSKNEFIC